MGGGTLELRDNVATRIIAPTSPFTANAGLLAMQQAIHTQPNEPQRLAIGILGGAQNHQRRRIESQYAREERKQLMAVNSSAVPSNLSGGRDANDIYSR